MGGGDDGFDGGGVPWAIVYERIFLRGRSGVVRTHNNRSSLGLVGLELLDRLESLRCSPSRVLRGKPNKRTHCLRSAQGRV